MINWKSILSSFNDKPTLLEWLKLVEKALKESVLTNVLTDTKDGKTAFTFKFEDGTEITTDYVQTQGEQGPQGNTGAAGVSVTGIEEVSDEIVGDQTLTTIRVHYSNGTFDEFPIYAQNGTSASGTSFYNHSVFFSDSSNRNYRLTFYSGSGEQDTKELLLAVKPIGGILNGYTDSDGFVDYLGMVINIKNSTGDFIEIECDGLNKVTHTQNKFILKVVNSTVTPYNGAVGPKGDKGDKGDTGATGPQGPKGDKGLSVIDYWETTINNTDTDTSKNFSGKFILIAPYSNGLDGLTYNDIVKQYTAFMPVNGYIVFESDNQVCPITKISGTSVSDLDIFTIYYYKQGEQHYTINKFSEKSSRKHQFIKLKTL